MIVRETYDVTVTPGNNAKKASIRMAHYIVQRWMPDNAGGVHMLAGAQLAGLLLPFFERVKPTKLRVDTTDNRPVISEHL